MLRHLEGLEKDEAGYVQGVVRTSAGAFIFLDTQSGPHDSPEQHGILCDRRLRWLEERLEENAGRPVYLFMHHPPFASGMTFMDRTRLRNDQDLARLLEGRQIMHLFLGHLHRPVSGSWRGVPFSVQASTCFQVALEMGSRPDLILSHEPPAYGVVLLTTEKTVIHQEYFLDRSPRIILKKWE
jgi:3',5'-cyclic AMP phosphodiesterase CpdA